MHPAGAAAIIVTLLGAIFRTVDAFTGDPHEILDLKVHKPKKTIGYKGNWQVAFHLHDPDPLTNSYTDCYASWKLGKKAPTDYITCDDDSYGFRFKDFKGPQKFTVETLHSFKDPSVGDPPQDVVTTFARGYINSTNSACKYGKKAINCHETKSPIDLKIYAAIA